MIRTTAIAALLVVTFGGLAQAQEKGQVGIAIAYPESVGLVWHISDRVAVRPDVSFRVSSSSSETTDSPFLSVRSTSSDSSTFVVGLSALFYVRKWDSLNAYVCPRFGYGHSNSTITSSASSVLPESTFKNSIYETSGSFGVQYAFVRRFSVFGEVGVAYTHAVSESAVTLILGSGPTNSLNSKAGVGIVFYF